MRARRSISASASVLAFATISPASCLARSSMASRSLSTDAALASYSAFSASASLRSDSASASWSRISAILLSSARPTAPGTRFQMRSAKTISTASATHPPGLSQKAVGSAASGASAIAAISKALDIELRLHGCSRLFPGDGQAGDAPDHFLSGFGRDRLDLGPSGSESVADRALSGLDLEIDLVGCGLDLRFGLEPALRFGVLGGARGLGARGIHSSPPCGFGFVGRRPRLLRRLEVAGDALLARLDRR